MGKNRNPKTAKNSKKRPRGRVAGTRISVHAPYVISALVERLSLNGTVLTYQDVADVLTAKTGLKVTRAEAWRLAHDPDGKVPNQKKNNNLRAALGLPATIEVPACPKCGDAHTVKRPRHPKTFAENAAAYDAWLVANEHRLQVYYRWARLRAGAR